MSRLPMPSAMPAEIAERLSDQFYDVGADEQLRERALDDLVDRILASREYADEWTKCRRSVLEELDYGAVLDAVSEHLADPIMNDIIYAIKKLLRAYLENSKCLDLRMDEMREEEEVK